MLFVEKLKTLRIEHHITQRQLASALNIDVAMYNRFEKGERKMRRDLVVQLANYYGLSEDELIKYWLAGQVHALLSEEGYARDVISIVAEDIAPYDAK